MSKPKKQEIALSLSGYEYDKELARVSIKASPALQALIANQLELMDKVVKCFPEEHITIEQLKLELIQVEEEMAFAFSRNSKRREEQRVKRELKKQELENTPSIPDELPPFHDSSFAGDATVSETGYGNYGNYEGEIDQEVALSALADKLSPGLPSEKYEPRTHIPEKKVEVDLRRVAMGASIKALESFLQRNLSEDEIVALEKQIESYLD